MAVSDSLSSPRLPGRQPQVWGRIPQRNKNFTGREELLERLHRAIGSDVTAVVPHALHGFGGVGKTQLAIEYAYRYGHEYELVWWIPADQPILVRSALAALAPHLGLPSATMTGTEDAVTAVLDALRRGRPYEKWLLIFDNADRPEDIQDVLPHGPGHVLITSRNHTWEGVVDTVAVDVFTRAESIEFLRKRAPRTFTEEDADRLAEELGDLPLALEQAGALQAETGMSVDEYLRLLKERATQLLDANKAADYPLSVTAAWSLSVAQIAQRLPEALELLRCCAFFGPEPIPRDVFGMLPEQYVEGSRMAGLLADPILLSKAIRELGRFALVRIDSESRTLQVHRLIQALLRADLSEEERQSFRHQVHLLLAAAAAPLRTEDNANWPRYAELLAHLTPADVAECQDTRVREFALNIVRYLYSAGQYQSAVDIVQRLLDRWRGDSGEDDLHVLKGQRHLGTVLRELGDYRRSFELNRATLERMRRVLGEEHEETLLLSNSFGGDLRQRGDFNDALRHDIDSLRRHQEVFGPDHRRTARAMNNLAVDYMLLGDYTRAHELQQEAYNLQRRQSLLDKQAVLIAWNGLARVVRLRGDYFEACDIGEDAYEFGIQELGADHPWTLRTAKDLSIAKRRAGRIDEAYELARQTYSRVERRFGRDHPDTLAAALCLANAQRTGGEVEQALDLLRDSAERFARTYGRSHPFTFGCDMNLALLLRVSGDLAAARELDEESLRGFDGRLGRAHHYSLTCAINLASDLAELGDVAAARRLGEETLETLREVLGVDHPLTLAGAANLAIDLRAAGEEQRAEELLADTIARYERVLGHGHPDTDVAQRWRRLDFDFDPPAV
jgi:tetratricopeptide (TPR) repeat protein